MFSQSVLDKIRTSAIAYATVSNVSKKETMPLPDQLCHLIGYRYSDEELEEADILNSTILDVVEHIRCEQDKARQNSNLYNSNRHICLHDLYKRLQKKRGKPTSAL